MSQVAIPFHFFRGATSRGPYFHAKDLPQDRDALAKVLIAVMGAGDPLNIDGLGGGSAVTTKVAILSPSDDPWADVDFLFAQVAVEDREVDFRPTCGNILVGVGPAAIEMGVVAAKGGVTDVNIRSVNTGAETTARVQTPGGVVRYDGDQRLDGVPGTAAPIELSFRNVMGSVAGAFLPTGKAKEVIDGVEVTLMDVSMPMMIARAADFGVTDRETRAEIDADEALFQRMEAMRLEAGRRMGLGDVSTSVTPKIGLIAPAQGEGDFMARYFMPWKLHPTMATTGSQCLASCALTPGTVAEGLLPERPASPAKLVIEHIAGRIEVVIDYALGDGGMRINGAGLIRTARLLARGEVMVPKVAFDR